MKKKSISLVIGIFLAALSSDFIRAASPSEEEFKQDMEYYQRIDKLEKLDIDDHLRILEKLREKYREANFDLSALQAEIELWENKRQQIKLPEPKKRSLVYARLLQVLITQDMKGSRLVLYIPGNKDFKDEIKRDEKDLPVIAIYLYDTQEALQPAFKNFLVKGGAIQEFRADKLEDQPSTVQVQITLREERPYKIERAGGYIIVTLEAQAVKSSAPSISPPIEKTLPIPKIPQPQETPHMETFSISLLGAVKTQGRLEIESGTRLLEAVYLAGGFLNDASDRLRVVRKDLKEKMILQQVTPAQAKDFILEPDDLVIVPEMNSPKQKIRGEKIILWATFFISMGLVLALLI